MWNDFFVKKECERIQMKERDNARIRKRFDSTLQSEGAEFLVVGQLLVQGVHAYKAYTRNALFDVIATHPENGKSVTIQVKSRLEKSASGFPLKPSKIRHPHFVVFVKLNREKRDSTWCRHSVKDRHIEFYIIPWDHIPEKREQNDVFSKVFLRDLPNGKDSYLNRWDMIFEKLNVDPVVCSRESF
jgi:hypothetical protein